MKEVKLSKVKDGGTFRLSQRSKIQYKLILKKKGNATITSLSSERSFVKSLDTVVYL